MNSNHDFYDPFAAFDRVFSNALALANDFDSEVEVQIPNKVTNSICSSTFPSADLYEEDDGYHIDIAISGYTKDCIDARYEDSYLIAHFTKPKTTESKKRVWIQQRIRLPEEAEIKFFIDTRKYDADKIKVDIDEDKHLLSVIVPSNSTFVSKKSITIGSSKKNVPEIDEDEDIK